LLASSPLVMLPIVRIIQRALLPRSRPSHVAEVFASGLFRVASGEPPTLDNAETVIYQLAESEYRSRLLERVPTLDRVVVIEQVSSYVVRGLNTSISSFRALLCDPRRAALGMAEGDRAVDFFSAFATVTADVLRGLGSQYDSFVESLERGEAVSAAIGDGGLDLLEFESEVAVFERDNTPELEAFEYESVEAIAVLKQFEFETATITTTKESVTRRGVFGLGRKVDRQPVITRRRGSNWGYTEKLSEEIGLDMMSIPGGTFLMGSPDDEPERMERESPQHEVTVSPFFLGRYAITQAQWRTVASYPQIDRELNPDPARFKGNNRPVEQVDWDEVTEFCQRLSAKTGKTYRLPSEAEWEYACRAGTTTPFHFGDLPSVALMNYDGNYTYNDSPKGEYRGQTVEVGSFPSNNFGLCDMHGNVWEWCEDDWHNSYEGAPTDGSAWLEENRTETKRLLRGGFWNDFPRYCRSAYRSYDSRDLRNFNLGFRVLCVSPRAL
jgi:formylglycine-generating enzyme required for sulfatase activity